MMKRFLSLALAVFCIGALAASPVCAEVVIASDDFEGVTPPALPAGWFSFAGGAGATTSVVTGTGGNPSQALILSADNGGSGYFVGARYVLSGALPKTNLMNLVLTADMMGSESAVSEFRIQSHADAGGSLGAETGRIEFAPTPGTSYGEVGGLLSTGANTTFDVDAVHFQIVIAFNDGGWGADTGNVLKVDNISFTAIPEPASLGMFAIVGAALLRRRR